jgi:O-antigen/teichoic acid export membrane protein
VDFPHGCEEGAIMLTAISKALGQLAAHQGFRRYFFNTSWMFTEQVLRIIAALFVGIYMARYLGPAQFGIYSYAIAFVALFGAVAKLGLDGIVVRDLVNAPEKWGVYLGTAFWLKLIGAVLSFVLLAIAVQFTNNDATTNFYIYIIASGLIFQSFEVVDFYFQSKVLSKYVSISKLIQLALSSLLKLYFIFTHADLFWFVMVSLIDQISLAMSLTIAYWQLKIGNFLRFFDLDAAKVMLRNSWPLILSGIAISLYMRIDQIMIKEMLDERAVGLYSSAVRLSEAWYFVPVIVTSSLFPAIVNAKKISEDLYNKRLQRLYFIMIYTAVGIALPVTLMAKNIVVTLYGIHYQDAGLVLSIHIWAGVFVGLGVANGPWFLSENLQKLATINTLMGAAINVVLNYFFIPIYGIEGVALATFISYGVAAYLALFMHKKTRAQFYKITSALLPHREWIYENR